MPRPAASTAPAATSTASSPVHSDLLVRRGLPLACVPAPAPASALTPAGVALPRALPPPPSSAAASAAVPARARVPLRHALPSGCGFPGALSLCGEAQWSAVEKEEEEEEEEGACTWGSEGGAGDRGDGGLAVEGVGRWLPLHDVVRWEEAAAQVLRGLRAETRWRRRRAAAAAAERGRLWRQSATKTVTTPVRRRPVAGPTAVAVVDEVVVAVEAEAEAASDASDDCPLAPGCGRGRTRSRAWAAVEVAAGAGVDIEPCPLLVLEPLLLQVQGAGIHQGTRGSAGETGGRRKETLSPSEQQKVARIMIGYTLAFFALAILTFYIVYFV